MRPIWLGGKKLRHTNTDAFKNPVDALELDVFDTAMNVVQWLLVVVLAVVSAYLLASNWTT